MNKSITLQKQKVSYVIRKSKRAKRMRLAIYGDGSVVVTLPHGAGESIIESFLKEKAGWLLNKLSFYKQFENTRLSVVSKDDYLKHKEEAYTLTRERVEHFDILYKFSYNKISIKNQRTRWGSCSRKGNLNFNYKILFLPPALRDYVIFHELCHLKEFNHSKGFWDLVTRVIPNYSEIRTELRRNGLRVK